MASKKIRGMLKTFMPNAAKPNETTSGGDDAVIAKRAAPAAAMPAMGARLTGAIEAAQRRRELHNKADHRVRSIESQVHSALGLVLDHAATLHQLSLVEMLGLADHVANALKKPGVRAEIGQRGLAIYEDQYVRSEALCMLGAAGDKRIAEALRAAGFARVGGQWAGTANIARAISLALEHGLTLLRHDDHDVIHYIKKGVRQPALADLEAEHTALLARAIASLAAVPAGAQDAAETGMGEVGDQPAGEVEPPAPVAEPEVGAADGAAVVTRPRAGFGGMAMQPSPAVARGSSKEKGAS